LLPSEKCRSQLQTLKSYAMREKAQILSCHPNARDKRRCSLILAIKLHFLFNMLQKDFREGKIIIDNGDTTSEHFTTVLNEI
jgi:hypothetical protein